jgi:hypothetical protein
MCPGSWTRTGLGPIPASPARICADEIHLDCGTSGYVFAVRVSRQRIRTRSQQIPIRRHQRSKLFSCSHMQAPSAWATLQLRSLLRISPIRAIRPVECIPAIQPLVLRLRTGPGPERPIRSCWPRWNLLRMDAELAFFMVVWRMVSRLLDLRPWWAVHQLRRLGPRPCNSGLQQLRDNWFGGCPN